MREAAWIWGRRSSEIKGPGRGEGVGWKKSQEEEAGEERPARDEVEETRWTEQHHRRWHRDHCAKGFTDCRCWGQRTGTGRSSETPAALVWARRVSRAKSCPHPKMCLLESQPQPSIRGPARGSLER